jgi:hypothetical protein
MHKLTLTSTFASTIMVGDPGYLTIPLPPKETKAVEVTAVQLRQLTPGLDKLKAAGWLNYVVDAGGPVAVKVEVKPVDPPPPPPSAPPPPAPSPEPVVASPVEPEPSPETPAADSAPEVPPAAPEAPPAAKPNFFDKKNRNR